MSNATFTSCIICYDNIVEGCDHTCLRCISKLDTMRCDRCGYRSYNWYLLSRDDNTEIPILTQDFTINLPSQEISVYIDGYRYVINNTHEVERDGKIYKIIKR